VFVCFLEKASFCHCLKYGPSSVMVANGPHDHLAKIAMKTGKEENPSLERLLVRNQLEQFWFFSHPY